MSELDEKEKQHLNQYKTHLEELSSIKQSDSSDYTAQASKQIDLAKCLLGMNGNVVEAANIQDLHQQALNLALEALSLLEPSQTEHALIADANICAGNAHWHLGHITAGTPITFYDRAIAQLEQASGQLDQASEACAQSSTPSLDIIMFTARKNRALNLHYLDRYDEAIAEFRVLMNELPVEVKKADKLARTFKEKKELS